MDYETNSDIRWRHVDISEDRYGGAYSHAAYTAWQGVRPDAIDAGDVSCEEFWDSIGDTTYGRGSTPQEAYCDLLKKLDRDGWDISAFVYVSLHEIAKPDSSFLIKSTEFDQWLGNANDTPFHFWDAK